MGGHREGIRNGGGGAAADLRKPPVHEVVAKLTPGEFERVVDIVRRSPDHFPSGTLAALKSHSPLPAGRPQSYSVSTDQAPRQGPIGTKPDGDRERGNIGTDRHARRPTSW